ncbi:maltose/moltooligosaccharide transporter [Kordia periserrulae]|uniref:Maltose/moltooligosaccharide transporter n=1 Tax=Kordia periserrulae TaxID=701523 RepID=A0A2T6BVQ7_9FLAO|nr:MFS transporter [Kordia periserrulae]PTX60170.1 maltose/moltooligosaccharide transporter [Kordia periserrulae]
MEKRKLSFWEIWNMSFGFLGIQFGFALQNANVSRIFETLGASKDELPILWLAAPVTGLLVQPVIGYFSDRTWHPKFGRRRPYFLIGAILASIALVIMPNSPMLWVAAGTLWIMDASINISMEPFRAFVGDLLPNEQQTKGYAMQSFFIGIGAVVASMLPYMLKNWFGFVDDPSETGIPSSVKWSFYLGAIAFFGAVLWTVFTTKEYPPEDMEEHEKEKNVGVFQGLKESFLGIFKMPKTMQQLSWVQFFSWFALFSMWIYTTTSITSHVYDMKVSTAEFTEMQQSFTPLMTEEVKTKIKEVENLSFSEKLKGMFVPNPERSNLKKLSAIDRELNATAEKYAGDDTVLLSKGLISFFLSKDVTISDALKERLNYNNSQYETGADWVGICFAVYNGIAAIFAIFLPFLARRLTRKVTHMLCLIAGGIGLISILFINNDWHLLLSMIGVGIAWASILSMPYAMLAGALPTNKMGYYMGVFNFFIVIPQIISAGILGYLLNKLFNGDPIYALVIGGVMMILAGILTLRVNDNPTAEINE